MVTFPGKHMRRTGTSTAQTQDCYGVQTEITWCFALAPCYEALDWVSEVLLSSLSCRWPETMPLACINMSKVQYDKLSRVKHGSNKEAQNWRAINCGSAHWHKVSALVPTIVLIIACTGWNRRAWVNVKHGEFKTKLKHSIANAQRSSTWTHMSISC